MEESDPAWRTVAAGMVAMRLVDTWAAEGSAVVAADSWNVTAVVAAIEQVPQTTPVRSVLRSVVDAMVTGAMPGMHVVLPRLMAYGQSLEYDSKMRLAADVYRTGN